MSETDTTTNTISCPADGCEYSGQSVPAVRAHVNSIGDPEHPMWGEIKDDIDTESSENQTESSENQERDSNSMPTTDEYEQQYTDDSDTDDTDDSNTTGSVSLPNLPMNPTTLLVLLVIGVSLYMTYSMVGSGSSGTPTAEEATTEDTTPDIDGTTATQSNDDIQQGLVG